MYLWRVINRKRLPFGVLSSCAQISVFPGSLKAVDFSFHRSPWAHGITLYTPVSSPSRSPCDHCSCAIAQHTRCGPGLNAVRYLFTAVGLKYCYHPSIISTCAAAQCCLLLVGVPFVASGRREATSVARGTKDRLREGVIDFLERLF